MPDRPIDEARNRLTLGGLQEGADAILFWDSDMRPPSAGLTRLMARDKPVVSGLSFARVFPHYPISLATFSQEGNWTHYGVDIDDSFEFLSRYARLWPAVNFGGAMLPEDDQDVLVERAAVGMAFTLIKREVFEKVLPDWRETDKKGELPQWFKLADGVAGEDGYFCELAKRAGYTVWLDRSVIVGHGYGDAHIGPMDFLTFIKWARSLPQEEFERVTKIGMQ